MASPTHGHEFEQALGVGNGQGSLACCSPWGCRVRSTEQLNWLIDWLAIGLSVVSRLKEEEKRILLDRGVEYWTTIKMLAEEQIYSIYRLVLNSFSKSREPAPLTGPRKQYFPGWPGKRKYKFALVFPSPFQKPGIRREKGRKWVIWKINWIRASKR